MAKLKLYSPHSKKGDILGVYIQTLRLFVFAILERLPLRER